MKLKDAQDNIIEVSYRGCYKHSDGNSYPVPVWVRRGEWDRVNALGLFEIVPEPPPEPTIEEQRQAMICTPWQFRKALNQTGNRGAVNAAINQADQDTKDGWEVASQFERLHPMVVSFGQALGLTDTELDDLFTLAATL